MIHDAFLKFADAQRPLLSTMGVGFDFHPFPAGAGQDPLYWDLLGPAPPPLATERDVGDGYPLKARMDITQTFVADVGAGGNVTQAAFGAALSNDPGFLGTDQIILTESHPMALATMTIGTAVNITLPKLSDIHALGRRFLFLGLRLESTTGIGNNLFTAGLVKAYIMLDADQAPRQPYAAGWNAKGA